MFALDFNCGGSNENRVADEELLQTAISVSQERREYVSGSDEGVKATSTSNEVRPPHAPSYLYSDTSFDQTATTTQERKHRVMQENVAQPLPEGNNIESLRQQIMQLQLALTSPPPLAPGLEGSPPTVEEYNRLIAQRQEACERLYSLYSYMKQIDDMAARQGHNTLGVSQQLAFLTSGPHAAVACPPIQAAYIKLFQTGSWRLPRKSKGRFMTSQETRLIASMQGRQLYFAGANNPGADWYLHMWRARRLQKIAQQYGFENIPEDTVLPAGSVQPMENSMDDTKLSVVWGNWTKSRLWETFNHVLGRAEKGSLNKPRRLLNLGDEPELPEKATKAPQADETPEQEDKQRVFEERKQEAKRKESQTRAAAKMLAGKLTEENPDKQSLWSARAAISAAHDALVCVRDAANLRSVRLKSAPAPSVEETEAMQQQIKRALAQLVRNLGLETNFEFGETKQQGQTNSHSLEELATPSDDGLAMLMIIVSMSKGKKLVCRAVPWLPPGPVAALITAAMQHLPHFVASAAEGSDAEEADELLSQSLAKWIRTAVMPQQNAADRVTLDLLTIWIRHLVESHDASILQALLNHPGGAKVFVALLERGKEEADALQNYFQSPNLDKRKKAQLGKSIDQWNKLTEKLAAATQSSS